MTQTSREPQLDTVERSPARTPQRARLVSAVRLAIGVPMAWFIGAIASTSMLFGLLALGFTYRWMSRTARKSWWRQSARTEPFDLAMPRWVLSSEPGWRGWLGGLWDNLRVGVVGGFHATLAMVPSAALWMFAWRYGWDNSFTKGYDLKWIGPATGLLGTALFMGTMLWVPLAQARHAATRSWRAFWDIGILATLLKRSWTGAVPLAAAYALLGVPFTVMWVIPALLPVNRPEMLAWSPAEIREWLDGYYFLWAILGFATYFGLKQLAARWYANALLDAVRSGSLTRRQLHPVEAESLSELGLLQVKDLSHRHPLVRAADWTASALGRSVGLATASLLWGFVAFQLFAGLFFHYRPIVGWMNQPLILIPAFKYVPPGLEED